jgi:hypothetical protein
LALWRRGSIARAPDVLVDGDNQVWVAWHAGTGESMTVKALRYRAP